MEKIDKIMPQVMPQTWRRTSWRDKHPSLKQHRVLVDNGYAVPATRGEAADMIAMIAVWEDEDV
jgi:hypothetical protein